MKLFRHPFDFRGCFFVVVQCSGEINIYDPICFRLFFQLTGGSGDELDMSKRSGSSGPDHFYRCSPVRRVKRLTDFDFFSSILFIHFRWLLLFNQFCVNVLIFLLFWFCNSIMRSDRPKGCQAI